MTQPAPIKEPIVQPNGYATHAWIRWFQDITGITSKSIVNNPSSPYTVIGDDEVIFINTSSTFVVNLKPAIDGRKVRVINLASSTANVSLTPNGSDLLYGTNTVEPVLPGGARELDGSTSHGWF